MAKYLNELEYVEQELAELRNQLEQSFKVLNGLGKVQAQFENLAQTYQKLKEHLDEVKATQGDIAQVEATFNHRFAELEKVIDSQWRAVKTELFNVQNEPRTAELAQQVNDLKADVEERLTVSLQEWASYKEAIHVSLDDLEARLRTELQASMNQLSEAGFNNQHFEKQERLEHELRLSRSSLGEMERQVHKMERQIHNLERQLRVMSNWVVLAVLTTVIAVGLALGLTLLSR